MAATYAEVRHFSANPSLSQHPVRPRSNVDARHERPLAAFATTLPHACSCPSLSERREISSPGTCHPLLAFGGSLATPGPIAGHRPFLAATRARSSRRGPIPPQAAKSTNRQRAQQCRGGACRNRPPHNLPSHRCTRNANLVHCGGDHPHHFPVRSCQSPGPPSYAVPCAVPALFREDDHLSPRAAAPSLGGIGNGGTVVS